MARAVAIASRNTWPMVARNRRAVSCFPRFSAMRSTPSTSAAVMLVIDKLPSDGRAIPKKPSRLSYGRFVLSIATLLRNQLDCDSREGIVGRYGPSDLLLLPVTHRVRTGLQQPPGLITRAAGFLQVRLPDIRRRRPLAAYRRTDRLGTSALRCQDAPKL